jgi:hypothetical protein
MNNNKLTVQTLEFISSNFQLTKFEVLNVDASTQNIGTNDFRVEALAGRRIIRVDFDYHSKIKGLSVLLSEHECERAKMPISSATLMALSTIAAHFSYGLMGVEK